MKLAWKIMLGIVITVSIAVSWCGYTIIDTGFHAQLDRNVDALADETRLFCVTLSALYADSPAVILDSDPEQAVIDVFNRDYFRVYPLTLYNGSNRVLRGSGSYTPSLSPADLGGERMRTRLLADGSGNHGIELIAVFTLDGTVYYLDNYRDVTGVFATRDQQLRSFRLITLSAVAVSLIIGLVLSALFTRPVRRLSDTVHAIADGDYSRRCAVTTGDEIGLLAESFNHMANRLSNQMTQLEDAAKRQRDFTASFAHELKTPMTSIIGYADTMRSRELTQEQRVMAANYIFTEGKRLEAMSHALLDLFALEKNTVSLSPVQTIPIARSVGASLDYLLDKRRMVLDVQVENASVLAERELLKTLLYNLLDNAMKASEPGMKITLSGAKTEKGYLFRVVDRGRGIPPEALDRITDPFYMVDKSRSRAEGGAGLGLALCSAIAQAHGTRLEYTSRLGRGTTVTFLLKEAAENG